MIGKLLAILLGVVLGASLLAIVLGLSLSLLMVLFFTLTLILRRAWVPLIYNVRSLAVRKVTSGVTSAGISLVVFVFATVLMLGAGIEKTMSSTGRRENAKVIRKGSITEVQSIVDPDPIRLLASQPEIGMNKDGKALVSAEVLGLIFLKKAGATDEFDGTNIATRGIGPLGVELHPEVKIDGRMFNAGTSEIIVGRSLLGRFQGLTVGSTVRFARRDWNIVGVIDAGGSAYNSEIWGDVDQFLDAFQRRPSVSSVTLRLRDSSALEVLRTRMAADPKLNSLEIDSEIDYWAKQSEGFANFIKYLGLFVAIIFSFGAILGAMITMYAQVAARTREIGALRALGFGRDAVLLSFTIESTLLALVSGVLGVAGASLMRFASFSTMNFQSFSEVSFSFTLTPGIVASSLLFAALMGYAGGLLPALRAARMPIVQATRGG